MATMTHRFRQFLTSDVPWWRFVPIAITEPHDHDHVEEVFTTSGTLTWRMCHATETGTQHRGFDGDVAVSEPAAPASVRDGCVRYCHVWFCSRLDDHGSDAGDHAHGCDCAEVPGANKIPEWGEVERGRLHHDAGWPGHRRPD